MTRHTHQNIALSTKLTVGVALVATTLLALLPFFKIGFCNIDDLEYFITAQSTWNDWQADHLRYARYSGRFYFLITKYFYYIPYLIDSFAYTKTVQYITLLACYALFAYLVGRGLQSQPAAVLTLLMLVAYTTITPDFYFMPTTNYPFYFTFSLILFMYGILLYFNYQRSGGRWRLWLMGAALFASCLFYEVYVLLTGLFAVAIALQHWRTKGLTDALRSRNMWQELAPTVGSVLLYCGCYFGYRAWLAAAVPNSAVYTGTLFASSFSGSNFVKVLMDLTRVNLPGQVYAYNTDLVAANSQLIAGHRNGLLPILTHASSSVRIGALLQCALLWWLGGRTSLRNISWRRLGVAATVAVVLAFAVHIPLAISEKYNSEWFGAVRCYVTSFFSYFGVMLGIVIAFTATIKAVGLTKWQCPLRAAWCAALLATSVVTSYSNEHIGREWVKSQNRFTAIDLMAREGYFDTLPDNAILYLHEFNTTSPTAYSLTSDTVRKLLERYINFRAKREISSTVDSQRLAEMISTNPDAPVYYLHAVESHSNCELLMAIAKLDSMPANTDSALSTSHADVFYLSPNKEFVVIYTVSGHTQMLPVSAERNSKITHFAIDGTGLDPRSILISNMTDNNI
ncbi:MAG: hypothetical protein K5650_01375 [Bacteroidales bacterium]|nr:hypothetical protein [Bacteroidales bacterium]